MKILSAIFTCLSIILPALASGQDNAPSWALPHISVAHVREEPRHSAEMSTQVLMGMPLKVSELTPNGWVKVIMPDGYEGYVIANSLSFMTEPDMALWRLSERVVVCSLSETKAYADTLTRLPLSDLVDGNIMQAINIGPRWTKVRIPDGREGFVQTHLLKPLKEWADAKPDIDTGINVAMAQMGVPYLWGGLSTKGMDCSGLMKIIFYHQGLIIPRDASQQACVGIPVDTDSISRGDLLFFGNRASGKITHVAIYLGDDRLLESSGRVRISRLSSYSTPLLKARRMFSPEGPATGITPASSHPWYF